MYSSMGALGTHSTTVIVCNSSRLDYMPSISQTHSSTEGLPSTEIRIVKTITRVNVTRIRQGRSLLSISALFTAES